MHMGSHGWSCAQVQQHEFNCPYQLGSPEIVPETDTAEDAAVYELDAEQGDILVLGTDGLFDNMWDDQLERIVNTHLQVLPRPNPIPSFTLVDCGNSAPGFEGRAFFSTCAAMNVWTQHCKEGCRCSNASHWKLRT